MTIRSNVHTHTSYCDGKNTPEEMIRAAIDKGFTCLGFSGHCYMPFDESYAMNRESTEKYLLELRSLKEKYRGIIDILVGTEWDYYGEISRPDYDFIIGSVHNIKGPKNGRYYTIDYTAKELEACLQEGFNNDAEAMLRAYYDAVTDMAVHKKPTILGHFDLIRKLNGEGVFFDEKSDAYLDITLGAAEKAVKAGTIFEVNTGGVYRGYRSTPYPAEPILKRIQELGGRVLLSSDAHDAEGIDFLFPEMEKRLKELGFQEIWVLTSKGPETIVL